VFEQVGDGLKVAVNLPIMCMSLPLGQVPMGAFSGLCRADADVHLNSLKCTGTPPSATCGKPSRRLRASDEDRKTAKMELDRMHKEARDDLIFIYQLRTRIVHNAYFHSQGTTYFVVRAQRFASLLIGAILADPRLQRSGAIEREIAAADGILKRLESDEKNSVLEEVRNRQDRPSQSQVFRKLAFPPPGRLLRPGRFVVPGGQVKTGGGFRF